MIDISKPVTDVILRAMLTFSLVVWAVVGFVFWVPLLLRATLVFSALVIHGTITGQRANAVRAYLEAAADFWFVGFRAARSTIFPESQLPPPPRGLQVHRVAIECLWAALVWGVTIAILRPGAFAGALAALTAWVNSGDKTWAFVVAPVLGVLLGYSLGRAGRGGATAQHSGQGNPSEAA